MAEPDRKRLALEAAESFVESVTAWNGSDEDTMTFKVQSALQRARTALDTPEAA